MNRVPPAEPDANALGAGHRTVVLVLSHVIDKDISAYFHEIKKECSGYCDTVFLCDNSRGVFDAYKENEEFCLFTMEDLVSLNYPERSAVVYSAESRKKNPYHKNFNFSPGNTDLPILLYYRNNPHYDHYWVIEYDVRYSGSWRQFFSHFATDRADLLGTTLTRYNDVPGWYHWPSLDLLDAAVGKDSYLRGFFPVYRLSNRALAQIDRDYRRGIKGHYECLIPTALHQAGMTIADIGGDGEFVRPEYRNRFYRNTRTAKTLSPGSFVFRPVRSRPGKERDMLWHPVKRIPAWRIAARWIMRQIGR